MWKQLLIFINFCISGNLPSATHKLIKSFFIKKENNNNPVKGNMHKELDFKLRDLQIIILILSF